MRRFYLLRIHKRKRVERNYELAAKYHRNKLTGYFFKQWLQWVQYRKDRQSSNRKVFFYESMLFSQAYAHFYMNIYKVAFAKLARTSDVSLSRLVMQQWHLASRETRQTREYFEVIL